MLSIARTGRWARIFTGLMLCWIACGVHAQSTSATGQTPQLQRVGQAIHKQANDATPAVDVSGFWRGTLAAAPGDPAGAVWDEELELHQDASGNIYGTRRTTPELNAVSWINWSVTGTVSGNTLVLTDTTLLGQGNLATSPCITTWTATVSADGTGISGNWTAPSTQTGCTGGALGVTKLPASPAKNLGDGGRCDGGEGIAGGNKSGSSGSSASEPTCDSQNGATTTGAPSVGDPINFATGNFFLQEDDYVENGWLTFRRFYNSDPTVAPSQSGSQWRHSFNRSLMIMGSPISIIVMYRPDGQEETFTKTGNVWSTELAVDRLTENADAQGNVLSYSVFIGATRRIETYDTSGKLISVVGQDGQGITLTYSTSSTPFSTAPVSGLLIAVTDPNGRQLKFVYYSNIKLESVTLPDGGQLDYGYSLATGDTTEVQYPDGKNRQYFYNESSLTGGTNLPNSMTGIQDESGNRYESISYDSQGRATSSVFTGNVGATHVAYNPDGSSSVTYPLGHVTNFGVTMVGGLARSGTVDQPCGPDCQQPWKSRTYDANGYPASYTDFNNVTTTVTYDSFGLLEQQIDAVGTTNQRVTVTTWDSVLRNPLTRKVSDANGVVLSQQGWAYNVRGQALAACEMDPTVAAAASYVCSASGSVPAGVRRTTDTYCDTVDTTQCPLVGLTLSETGPRTDLTATTHFSYYMSTDESGCGTVGGACHHLGDLYQITDALNHTHTMLSYDKTGRVARFSDPNGILTDIAYAPRGWVLSKTAHGNLDGSASPDDATTSFTYDAMGNLKQVKDADGVVVNYQYDNAHRLTDITDALGNRLHFTLDANGNRVKEQIFDTSSVVRKTLSRTFNGLGQLTNVTDGLGHTVADASFTDSYDSNGNLIHTADALSVQRKLAYDNINRLIGRTDDYNGSSSSTKNAQVVYAYDALDRTEGVTDPDNISTTYDYDGLGNLQALHSPDTGTTQFTFDLAGNRITKSDANINNATYQYDALDRLISVTNGDPSANLIYTYDEPNSVSGCATSYPIGRLTTAVSESGTTTHFCYDVRGNVISKLELTGIAQLTTRSAFTPGNRRSEFRPPANPSNLITYTFDANGRISAIGIFLPDNPTVNAPVVGAVTYLPFGPVQSYTLGNGQVVSRTYDANYRPTDITSPALNLHFSLDAAGDITALGNASGVSSPTETYQYDSLYHLTSLTDPTGVVLESYTYTKTGDRLSKTGAGLATGSYGYQSGTHRLMNVGNAARVYDAVGDTTGTSAGGQTFGYGFDPNNRLEIIQKNAQTTAQNGYDAFGKRTLQDVIAGTEVDYSYDTDGHLVSERHGQSKSYIWLNDTPVAVENSDGLTTNLDYVHADALDTPRVITDSSGAVKWQWAYQSNPFGEKQPTSIAGYTFNLRFAGQYYDANSGLVQNGYRDYDPSLGRYTESDPLGLNGGLNTYAYVGSNPLFFTDEFGLAVPPGHHVFPRAVWKGLDKLSSDARTLFRDTVVKPATKHGWSRAHNGYNRLAQRAWDKFCKATNADLKTMTRETAQDFLDYIKSSPQMNQFNQQVQSGQPLTEPDETQELPEVPPTTRGMSEIPEEVPAIPPELLIELIP